LMCVCRILFNKRLKIEEIRAAKALLRSSVLVHFSIVAFARCRYVSASVLLEVVGASKSLAAVRTFESLLSRVCTNVSL